MLREIVQLIGLGLYLIGILTLTSPAIGTSAFVGGMILFLVGATITATAIAEV